MPSWEGKSKTTPLGYRIFVGILKTFRHHSAQVMFTFKVVGKRVQDPGLHSHFIDQRLTETIIVAVDEAVCFPPAVSHTSMVKAVKN